MSEAWGEPVLEAGRRVWVTRYLGPETIDTTDGAEVGRATAAHDAGTHVFAIPPGGRATLTPVEGDDLGFATVLAPWWSLDGERWEYELVTDEGRVCVGVPERGDELMDLFSTVPEAVIQLARLGVLYGP